MAYYWPDMERGERVSSQPTWAQWLEGRGAQLLLFARTQTRNDADAEDVVQETLAELFRKSPVAPPPLPVVYATVRRRAIDLGRSTNRRLAREEAATEGQSTTCWFDDSLEQRERAQLLDAALRRLPANQREVVTLKLWGDLTFAQIAETLDIPINTAASRYRYGLAFLRQHVPLEHP